jgi:hypothetical protein
MDQLEKLVRKPKVTLKDIIERRKREKESNNKVEDDSEVTKPVPPIKGDIPYIKKYFTKEERERVIDALDTGTMDLHQHYLYGNGIGLPLEEGSYSIIPTLERRSYKLYYANEKSELPRKISKYLTMVIEYIKTNSLKDKLDNLFIPYSTYELLFK